MPPYVAAVAPNELGNRLRAARGYAAMSQDELANRLGMSLPTFQRTEMGQRGLKPYEKRALVEAVADETGLPSAFFTVDLAELGGPPVVESDGRLDAIEKAIEALTQAAEKTQQDHHEALERLRLRPEEIARGTQALTKKLDRVEKAARDLERMRTGIEALIREAVERLDGSSPKRGKRNA